MPVNDQPSVAIQVETLVLHVPFAARIPIPVLLRDLVVVGQGHRPYPDLLAIEQEGLFLMTLGRGMMRMEGIKRLESTAVEENLHPSFPLFPSRKKPVKDELEMRRGLVELTHEILTVTLAVGPDDAVELLPHDERAVAIQAVGPRDPAETVRELDNPPVASGDGIQIPSGGGTRRRSST